MATQGGWPGDYFKLRHYPGDRPVDVAAGFGENT